MASKAITNKFITEKYDINDERSSIDYKERIGELEIDFNSENPLQAIELIQDLVWKLPGNCYIVTENYGYDGGSENIIYINKTRPETDSEVLNRLKKFERDVRNKLKKIEAAKKLLEIE